MAQQTLSLKVLPIAERATRDALREAGFAFEVAPYAFWRARGDGAVVVFYRSGKLVLQGPAAPAVAALLGLSVPAVDEANEAAPQDPVERFAAALALHPDPKPTAWVGTDETGKGDYFGPLIVAAVRLERDHVPLVAELGAADSKTLSDQRILELAPDLKRVVAHELVVVGPEAYNRLYANVKNLNRLLAWAHARALEDLLQRVQADYALTDQFGDPRLVENRLMAAGRKVRLEQRPRAEADPAVAVASILARHELIWRFRALSKDAGFVLPKGAGPKVLAAGRRLVQTFGEGALQRFAKTHFATTRQILAARRPRGPAEDDDAPPARD